MVDFSNKLNNWIFCILLNSNLLLDPLCMNFYLQSVDRIGPTCNPLGDGQDPI